MSGRNYNIFKGIIFGQALGDAVGLQAEFRFKKDIGGIENIIFPMKAAKGDFVLNDWTDDTDQAIIIIDTLKEADSSPMDSVKLRQIFGRRLLHWINNGFKELGDTVGQGCGGLTITIKNMPGFGSSEVDPAEIAREVWLKSGRTLAPNGAIMRGAACFYFLLSSAAKTEEFKKRPVEIFYDICYSLTIATHYDIRCIISVLFLNSLLVHISAGGDLINLRAKAFEDVIAFIRSKGDKFVADHAPIPTKKEERGPTPSYYNDDKYFTTETVTNGLAITTKSTYNFEKEFFDYCRFGNEKGWIPSLELDKAGRIGYTYKTMSCAAWVAYIIEESIINKQNKKGKSDNGLLADILNFKKIIKYIAAQGGDADTNCAVVGAVLGAWFGFDVLEILVGDWIGHMPNSSWLEQRLNIGDVRSSDS